MNILVKMETVFPLPEERPFLRIRRIPLPFPRDYGILLGLNP